MKVTNVSYKIIEGKITKDFFRTEFYSFDYTTGKHYTETIKEAKIFLNGEWLPCEIIYSKEKKDWYVKTNENVIYNYSDFNLRLKIDFLMETKQF